VIEVTVSKIDEDGKEMMVGDFFAKKIPIAARVDDDGVARRGMGDEVAIGGERADGVGADLEHN
jgi:hypothetical protein